MRHETLHFIRICPGKNTLLGGELSETMGG
jgi:hypothetical protein